MENPDSWVLVRLTNNNTNEILNRILATWRSSYLGGEYWRLSTKIVAAVPVKNGIATTTESGNKYLLPMDTRQYTMGSMASRIWMDLSELSGKSEEYSAELLSCKEAHSVLDVLVDATVIGSELAEAALKLIKKDENIDLDF